MEKIEALHNQAMDLAEKAIIFRIRKRIDESIDVFNEAFLLEKEAAMLLKDLYEFEPSRSIMFRSAASLALNARLFRDAEKMIAIGLSGNPSESIADELRNLYENINFEKHLQLRGVTLTENDVQLSLAGSAVSYGMIKADEFIRRAEIINNMTIRTAERLLNRPFRENGRVPKEIKEDFETYYSIPRAPSFALTLRIGYKQKIYDLFEDNDIQTVVIDEIIENIKMVNNRDEKKLKEKIANEDYFSNSLALIKKLSPDNKAVSLVGLTAIRNGNDNKVAFTRTTEEIKIAPIIHNLDVSNMEEIIIHGKLEYANANTDDIRLRTEEELYTICVPKGLLADIVKPYWEQHVTIKGKKQDKKIFFEDLQVE